MRENQSFFKMRQMSSNKSVNEGFYIDFSIFGILVADD